jgi:hypothetical protein
VYVDFLRQNRRRRLLAPLDLEHQPSPKELHENEHIDSNADAVVRVRKRSLRPDREPSKDQNDRRQQHRQNLQIDVQLQTERRIPLTEFRYQDSSRHDADEDQGGDDGVAAYEGVVLRQFSEAIAHAVVAHCVEVDAHQVGQQEGVAVGVPCSVADGEAVALVAAATGI